MSYISNILLLFFLLINFGKSDTENVMNKELYINKGQEYLIPTSDTVAKNENFKFDPLENVRIIKSGAFNFKQKTENKNDAIVRICSNNGKCFGRVTFCYLTNSETNVTSFCPSGQDGLQFEMTQNGLLSFDQNIGFVEWAGSSCAVFGYLNENIVIGTPYANFSLPSEKMEFQKLPNSTFNQFLASLYFPNDCSIEPIEFSVLIRTTSKPKPAAPKVEENKEEIETYSESADLIFLLYIGAGVLTLLDFILGIIIIIVITLEKRRKRKERKKELEERLRIQAAIIAFEAKKREREKQREERKQKLEKAKPLKHINTESEKLVIETRPQRLYVPERGKLPDEDESKKDKNQPDRKDDTRPTSISEKSESQKPKKKKRAGKKKAPKESNSTLASFASKKESQSKHISSGESSGVRML